MLSCSRRAGERGLPGGRVQHRGAGRRLGGARTRPAHARAARRFDALPERHQGARRLRVHRDAHAHTTRAHKTQLPQSRISNVWVSLISKRKSSLTLSCDDTRRFTRGASGSPVHRRGPNHVRRTARLVGAPGAGRAHVRGMGRRLREGGRLLHTARADGLRLLGVGARAQRERPPDGVHVRVARLLPAGDASRHTHLHESWVLDWCRDWAEHCTPNVLCPMPICSSTTGRSRVCVTFGATSTTQTTPSETTST